MILSEIVKTSRIPDPESGLASSNVAGLLAAEGWSEIVRAGKRCIATSSVMFHHMQWTIGRPTS